MNNETIYYSHPHSGGKPFARGFGTRLDAVKFAEKYAFPDAGDNRLNIYTEEEFEAWCADNDINDKPDSKVYPEAERKALAVYVDKVRSVFAAGHEKVLVVSSGDETVLPYSHQAYEDAVIEQANQAEYVELLARSDYEHYVSTGTFPKHGSYTVMKAIREEAKCLGWKNMGRPTLDGVKRVPLNCLVHPETKDALKKESAESGDSIGQLVDKRFR